MGMYSVISAVTIYDSFIP